MKKIIKNEKIIELFMIILVFISILSIIFIKELGNLDEIWNYNFAQNVSNGLMPYKEFNMLQMPLLPLINGLILKLTCNELIVMRIVAAIMCTAIFYVFYKILNLLNIKKEISVIVIFSLGYLFKDFFCIDYNYATLLVTLILLYFEIKNYKKDNKLVTCNFKRDLLLGILAGTTITLKQTSGILIILAFLGNKLLFVNNKNEFKIYLKGLGYRLIGVIIPIILMFLYIILNGAFNDFIDYTIKGTKEFSNFFPYINLINYPIINVLAIIVPLVFIYSWIKSIIKDFDVYSYLILVYSLAMFIIVFPISDKIHFLIGSTIGIILFVYELSDILNKLYKKFIKDKSYSDTIIMIFKGILLTLAISNIIMTSYFMITNINKYVNLKNNFLQLKHYKYIPINENEEKVINVITNYISNSEEKVIVLNPEAAVYMIPLDRYNKNYDMLLKGNLGSNSFAKITEEIEKNNNVKYLILKEKYMTNWQTPIEIVMYTTAIKEKIDEVGSYDVYK